MAEYDNSNTFALFKNDKGDNPKRPDYTGTVNVNGEEMRISGWIRESKKGVKYISGQLQAAEEKIPYGSSNNKELEDVPF